MVCLMNKQFHIGQHYRITAFTPNLDKNFQRKLIAMGLHRGAQFSITRIAPLGDPIELCVSEDYALSLRKKELAGLEFEAIVCP